MKINRQVPGYNVHIFYTLEDAQEVVDELQKNDPHWTYKACQITEHKKNAIAIYKNNEFITYWHNYF